MDLDPDPDLRLMDPDPGDPETCGPGTLPFSLSILFIPYLPYILTDRIGFNGRTSVVDPDPDPGSGSVLDPYSIGPLDPDPDP
jgi:hypothetical protein